MISKYDNQKQNIYKFVQALNTDLEWKYRKNKKKITLGE